MDNIVKQLATAFGIAVSIWAGGVAMILPLIVKCLTDEQGWALFVLDEYQTVGLAAAIAGPVALTLRLAGFRPACPHKSDPPEKPKENADAQRP